MALWNDELELTLIVGWRGLMRSERSEERLGERLLLLQRDWRGGHLSHCHSRLNHMLRKHRHCHRRLRSERLGHFWVHGLETAMCLR